ncbi:cytochrome P450 4c3-like [Daphnia carinata]|uniref:cytochrome P450 4c3-like n=1 Tax=Daphnia carinata TaxID=120202 RepID=UPI00257C2416|nr:cytochrome P450 4c3-like [Daphnia carinata]
MDVTSGGESSVWISSFSIYTVTTILATLVVLAVVKRYNFMQRCNKVLGSPTEIPLFGGGSMIFVPPEEIMNLLLLLHVVFGRISPSGIIRAWIGPLPMFFATTAEAVEAVLSSNKIITKSREYDFLHPWLNTGLLTSTGSKWQTRRKLLTPAFHFKILEDFVHVFNEQSRILVNKLNQAVAKDRDLNIFPFVTLCTLDIICETAMGRNVEAQSKKDSAYVQAVYNMSQLIQHRQVRFYLWADWMFKLSSFWPEQRKALDILHGFTNKVIQERKAEHRKQSSDIVEPSKDVTEDAVFSKRRRLAFLDLLIEASQGGTVLSDSDIREEVDTFMFEGHDTTSAAISWSIFLIGCHPEVQETVNEELDRVFGDSDRPATMADLNELKYLECCIKEALRLYPSVPIISRTCVEDTVIGGDEIPAGTSVSICSYYLHRDPKYFPDPELYQPKRFLAEHAERRHPYSYVPFSAGPRNCIGQRFALMEEKAVLSAILRNFHVQSLDKREEIVLLAELILRPRDGIRVRLEPKKKQ